MIIRELSSFEKLKEDRDRAFQYLNELQAAERVYRTSYEVNGGGAMITGRAWDKMRRSGDRARSFLDALALRPDEEPRRGDTEIPHGE